MVDDDVAAEAWNNSGNISGKWLQKLGLGPVGFVSFEDFGRPSGVVA